MLTGNALFALKKSITLIKHHLSLPYIIVGLTLIIYMVPFMFIKNVFTGMNVHTEFYPTQFSCCRFPHFSRPPHLAMRCIPICHLQELSIKNYHYGHWFLTFLTFHHFPHNYEKIEVLPGQKKNADV